MQMFAKSACKRQVAKIAHFSVTCKIYVGTSSVATFKYHNRYSSTFQQDEMLDFIGNTGTETFANNAMPCDTKPSLEFFFDVRSYILNKLLLHNIQ